MAPDPKLLYFIKNLLSERGTGSRPPSEDMIMERLVQDHREYGRKPKATLRKQVTLALGWCLERSGDAAAAVGTGCGGGLSSKKRNRGGGRAGGGESKQGRENGNMHKREKDGEYDEDKNVDEVEDEHEEKRGGRGGWTGGDEAMDSDAEYEREAQERERRLGTGGDAGGGEGGGGFNMLNNTLSSAYRKAITTTTAAAAATATTAAVMIDGTQPLQQQQHEQNEQQQQQHHHHQNRHTNGNSKLLRKKQKRRRASSTSSSSHPSSSTNPPPPSHDDDDPSSSSSSLSVLVERPSARFADLAGIDGVLQDVRELIEYPLTYPEVYAHLGVEPPRGILLHGPPGCGKTLLANAVAGELGVAFLKVSAPEVVSGMSGESEQKVRELFATARGAAPAIVFIDEVDAITPKRETASRGMERRIVAQLLTCLDALSLENTGGKPVLVIGATNRPDALDAALRRAGRFDREISLGVPDQGARKRILEVMTGKMKLSGDFDLEEIARITPGYVGADLASLTKEAAVLAINRIFAFLGRGKGGKEATEGIRTLPVEEAVSAALAATSITSTVAASAAAALVTPMEEGGTEERQGSTTQEDAPQATAGAEHQHLVPPPPPTFSSSSPSQPQTPSLSFPAPLPPHLLASLSITMADFLSAVQKVQPSSKREGFASVPNVSWKDIGALSSVREELAMSIIEPISHPEDFLALGLSVPAGVLLFGPPGCGKTLLAKAIANESNANFISIKGPELLDKYVGESERAVRQVFTRARASAPCIIFFDELDALCPKRGMGGGGEGGGGSGVSERVVNQLLTEMDGLEGRRHVFVIAATNRPELIDPAMLRPGRLDKLLYVPLPGPEDRASILQAVCRGVAIDRKEVDLDEVGRDGRAEGYSGADMAALVHEAGIEVLREGRENGRKEGRKLMVGRRHFEAAFGKVSPSVSARDQKRYLAMRHNLCRARGAAGGHANVAGEEEKEMERSMETRE
ncbi:hypothetical protein VYU27_006133 [Nannochloropsis oceanica]